MISKSYFQKSFVFVFALLSLFCFSDLKAQLTIAEARTLPLGTTVTLRGIVTNGAELGVIRYLQDQTAGIGLFDNSFSSSMNRGDSIEVTGVLFEFAGLLELSPVTAVNVISSGNTLPNPQEIQINQLSEAFESELIKLNNIQFLNPGGTFAGGTSYGITSGVSTATIFVRNGSALVGQLIPFGSINLTGICSQFNANYQVLARDTADFELQPGINFTSPITFSNITQNSATINWTTNIPGTTEFAYGLTPDLELGLQSSTNMVSNHSITVNNLEPGQIYYVTAFSSANGLVASSNILVFGTESNSSGEIIAYFNHPVDTSNGSENDVFFLNETMDDTLLAYLSRASETIDFTMYDFIGDSIANIAAALNDAHQRGVQVRIITDGSYEPENLGLENLNEEIPRIISPTGELYSIMHNKFIVIDANSSDPNKPIVWTGSTNLSGRQINRDPNNVIIIQDQTLARTYEIEFEEMWGSDGAQPDTTNSRFGPFKTDNTPHQFRIGGKRVECYFSPSDNTNQRLLEFIGSADDSLHFASMLITRFDIADAIADRIAQSVTVRGIVNSNSTTLVYDELLASMGTNLILNPIENEIMHHKFAIADVRTDSDPAVWTGSHNWSTNANTRNDENTVVVYDDQLAEVYYRAYLSMFNDPQPVDTSTSIVTVKKLEHKLWMNKVRNANQLVIVPGEIPINAVQIIDAAGKICQSSTLNATKNDPVSPFNAELQAGIYFVIIHSGASIEAHPFVITP